MQCFLFSAESRLAAKYTHAHAHICAEGGEINGGEVRDDTSYCHL